ncbi:MAG: hypothetical protein Q4B84_04925 [Clostridia bacterium]|nr:hypothetical protein [Clostridia bacterium]
MYGSIEDAVKEIAKDEKKLKEFLSLTDVDEIYEFINNIDPSVEKEEFDEFLVNALGTYVEQISDYDLSMVTGGVNKNENHKNIARLLISKFSNNPTDKPFKI